LKIQNKYYIIERKLNDMFFEVPTQVKFYEAAEEDYIGGIAYRNEIICGCCGSVFEISDVIAEAEEDGIEEPIVKLPWIDIQSEIIGE
jgi:hypothetical protein